jgi:hypothetical protein
MATTTPNYGWDVPTSSDYVKQGAVAIETLGDDIDATLWTALGGNYPGLRLIKKQAIGSGVSSVNVTSAFSATYEAYRIVITGVTASTSDLLTLKLGAVATGYYQTRISFTYAGVADNGFDNNTVRWTVCARGDATNGISGAFDLLNPFLTKYKFLHGGVAVPTAAGTVNGILQSTTSTTDFTIAPSSGTITGGTIYVYGYGAS